MNDKAICEGSEQLDLASKSSNTLPDASPCKQLHNPSDARNTEPHTSTDLDQGQADMVMVWLIILNFPSSLEKVDYSLARCSLEAHLAGTAFFGSHEGHQYACIGSRGI